MKKMLAIAFCLFIFSASAGCAPLLEPVTPPADTPAQTDVTDFGPEYTRKDVETSICAFAEEAGWTYNILEKVPSRSGASLVHFFAFYKNGSDVTDPLFLMISENIDTALVRKIGTMSLGENAAGWQEADEFCAFVFRALDASMYYDEFLEKMGKIEQTDTAVTMRFGTIAAEEMVPGSKCYNFEPWGLE